MGRVQELAKSRIVITWHRTSYACATAKIVHFADLSQIRAVLGGGAWPRLDSRRGVLRRGAHSHRYAPSKRHAYLHAAAYLHSDSVTNAYSHRYANAYSHRYANAYSHRYAYLHSDSDSVANAYSLAR